MADIDPEVLRATDGTPYTIDELNRRVTVIGDGIILLREIPNGTGEVWAALCARAREIAEGFPTSCWIVDITMVNNRPKGTYLESVRQNVATSGAKWLFLVTPPGSILQTIAKFAVGLMIKQVTFVPSVEEGIVAARSKLDE
jgi:hypothetical protein